MNVDDVVVCRECGLHHRYGERVARLHSNVCPNCGCLNTDREVVVFGVLKVGSVEEASRVIEEALGDRFDVLELEVK